MDGENSDVFLSYASEDEIFATKLRKSLEGRGLLVWQDKIAVRIGDSLSDTIRRGVEQARYGIVILSPHFLAKDWTQREFRWLSALETEGRKVILPVWHGVSLSDVRAFSSVLADRLAVSSSNGLRAVVSQLMKALSAAWIPPVLEWPSGIRAVVLPLRHGSRAYVLGEFLITNAQYQAFCQDMKVKQPSGKQFLRGSSKVPWQGPFEPWKEPNFEHPEAPVVCVTLSNAQRFSTWLNRQLPKQSHAELPSPDVWRRAATASGQLNASVISRLRWPRPLALSDADQRDAWGLIDLVGNVWQWTIESQRRVSIDQRVSRAAQPKIKMLTTPIVRRVEDIAMRQQRRETEGVWICGGSYLDDINRIKLRLPASKLEDGARTAHADLGFRVGGTVSIDTLPRSTRLQLARVPDLAPRDVDTWRLS